jgi:hypothetical protein
LATHKGKQRTRIEPHWHFVDLHLFIVLLPILLAALHEDDIGVVIVDLHPDLVSLLEAPPLAYNITTIRLLEPAFVWLN